MRFRSERDVLVAALTTAGRAASVRSPASPATSGIRLEVRGNDLTLVGTDLDLTLRVGMEVVGLDDGVCVAPARLAAEIVRAMEPGSVTMSVIEDAIEITAGRSRFAVRTYDASDFPALPVHAVKQVSLATGDLIEGLRQVVTAASTDQSRPLLTGVLITREANGLRLVATDSYRLAWRDLPSGVDLPVGTEQIEVPARALVEIQRLLTASAKGSTKRAQGAEEQVDADSEALADEADEGEQVPVPTTATIGLSIGESDATFWVDGVQVTTRLLDGQFPDYQALVPPEHTTSVRTDKARLIESLRRMKLLAQDNTTPVHLAISGDSIDLSVVSQEVGRATETVDASVDGEDMSVTFNPAYLIDGISAAIGEEVAMDLLPNATKPAIIRSPDHDDYRYLIMPVRVS